tara:strand:- start:185799 stop:186401 length:603 start_codon:yes stop_codon:yes gene_type:complete
MKNVLTIKASIRATGSHSSKLVDKMVQTWAEHHPEDNFTSRDLLQSGIPHLSEAAYNTMPVADDQRSAEQREEMALSDRLTSEFLAADVIIVGMPMYNFNVPSAFKAYIDHIARPGLTFRYTATGPVGLAGDKQVIFLLARGGVYWETPNDTQTPYLKAIFSFMGVSNFNFIVAEGLNISPEKCAEGMQSATQQIDHFFS